MPVVNHVHTYVKYKGRPGFYRCDAPDCTHFIDKESILGKYSLCTECGSQMILTKDDLRRARPKCFNCSNTKEAIRKRKAMEFANTLFKGAEEIKLETLTSTSEEEIKEPDV